MAPGTFFPDTFFPFPLLTHFSSPSCGSNRGGRTVVHFSLPASCKRHGHDPWAYYRDILTRLPAMLPHASEEDLLSLQSHLWKPA